MICRKCGCLLDSGTKICQFCEEPIEEGADTEDLITRVVGDDGAKDILDAIPSLIELKPLTKVPAEKETLLHELERLQVYFSEMESTYKTQADLWNIQAQQKEPSLGRWTLVGGLVTVLLYAVFASFLPPRFMAFFFVVWLGITSAGYVWRGRRYERNKAQLLLDLRLVDNALRKHYNGAEQCFLPFDYARPRVLQELISGLQSGTIHSFDEYRVQK